MRTRVLFEDNQICNISTNTPLQNELGLTLVRSGEVMPSIELRNCAFLTRQRPPELSPYHALPKRYLSPPLAEEILSFSVP